MWNSIGKKLLEIIRSFPVSFPVGWDQAAAEHKRAEAERLRLEVVFGLDGKKRRWCLPWKLMKPMRLDTSLIFVGGRF